MKRLKMDAIAPIFHFVWFGESFAEFGIIAIASALRKNPGSTAILWHGAELHVDEHLRRLTEQGLELRMIDASQLMREAKAKGASFDLARLESIYATLSAPAAKSNLIRLLAIYNGGGIYLDTDTITLKELSEFRATGAFCGVEQVLWPAGRRQTHVGALLLGELRRFSARNSWAYGLHKQLLRFYSHAANNAVLGFSAQHVFCEGLLAEASKVPESEWGKRYRFGTHLLQRALAAGGGNGGSSEGVTVYPPDYFYPVGPVVSQHYLRRTNDVKALRAQLIDEKTAVIHWYASVSELKKRGFAHIRENQGSEVYSHLCADYLP